MNSKQNIEKAQKLLEELASILSREGETNCIGGVKATLGFLGDTDIERGFANAKSVYRTMSLAKGGLSDYYIERADFVEQVAANERIDQIRTELWHFFQSA